MGTLSTTAIPRVDRSLTKFSQGCVVVLTGLAFLTGQPVIVLIAALCMIISVIAPMSSPFRLLYKYVLQPAHLLRPHVVEDDPAPHRFAQGIGSVFLIVASILFFLLHASLAGWILDLIVFVLASINLVVGFCAGCFVYYHLGRWGILPHVRYEGGFRWRGV